MTSGRDRFVEMKRAGRPMVMLTAYDHPMAVMEEEAGVDVIFVGDSVGTNVLGYQSEVEVTMDDMLHHVRAVRRGVTSTYLLADLPHRSYETPELAVRNAKALLEAGATGVKPEGGRDKVDIVEALVGEGIDVCGHIGYTPQTLARPGKPARVQARSHDAALNLIKDAEALDDAGVMMLVLELVTEGVARIITDRIEAPTVGIGAGRFCDGQVLVVSDLLGLSPVERKMVRRYAEWRETGLEAMRQYATDVREGRFPAEGNVFPSDPEDITRLETELSASASPSS
jgi:3-methyl-2-oxobutanoate hydroxymethyltransferase